MFCTETGLRQFMVGMPHIDHACKSHVNHWAESSLELMERARIYRASLFFGIHVNNMTS